MSDATTGQNATDEATEYLEHATDTARRIEAEAAAIVLLQEHAGDCMADLDVEIGDIVAARETLDMEPIDLDSDVADGLEDVCDRLAYESALSFEATGTNSGNGWETTGATIVLGTGGPHVEIRYTDRRSVVVMYGWWGAGRAEVEVDSAAVDAVYRIESWLECLEG